MADDNYGSNMEPGGDVTRPTQKQMRLYQTAVSEGGQAPNSTDNAIFDHIIVVGTCVGV